jgi:hypothetical protein
MPNRPFESIDRFRVPFRRNFDAAVRQIAHPAIYSFPARCRLGEKPEPHTLNTTTDEISSRDPHITLRDCRLRNADCRFGISDSVDTLIRRRWIDRCRWLDYDARFGHLGKRCRPNPHSACRNPH